MRRGWRCGTRGTMSEWLDTIRSATLLVSGRFHYTIASCMLDTPCIVLDSNTPKNRAVCEESASGRTTGLLYRQARLRLTVRYGSRVERQESYERRHETRLV